MEIENVPKNETMVKEAQDQTPESQPVQMPPQYNPEPMLRKRNPPSIFWWLSSAAFLLAGIMEFASATSWNLIIVTSGIPLNSTPIGSIVQESHMNVPFVGGIVLIGIGAGLLLLNLWKTVR